ncbi:MAG: DNA-processing protein DprA [Oscillospiraceae bacterium]|nr:DNA-processing protein DprA [Oscillospiraceae bacterium]
MNTNSAAIITICSHLCVGENVKPFEPSEWSKLASTLHSQNLQPKDLLKFSESDFMNRLDFNSDQTERLRRLIDRIGSIVFEIEKYENMGIKIVTRSDENYPKKLKKTLKNNCPPLFYYIGNLEILNEHFVGLVGSRDINDYDISFAQKTIDKVIASGFSIVSGGAKGIDSISRERALIDGGSVIEYISDSLTKKIKDREIISAIRSGKLIIISVAKPDAGFNVGMAMMRNKYIYAQSMGTVVVKSDLSKGGTWNGAMENLKNKWCCEFCWNNASYDGNMALIKNGAIPIDEDWNADVTNYAVLEKIENKQMSFFNV